MPCLSVPNHERSLANLNKFKEAQKLLGEKRSKDKKSREQKFSYLARKLPQHTLKSFDWFEERKIFKKLCRGEPMPQVSPVLRDSVGHTAHLLLDSMGKSSYQLKISWKNLIMYSCFSKLTFLSESIFPRLISNKPFTASCLPPLRSESKLKVFLMKISFHSYIKSRTNYHDKNFALRLA